MVCERCGVDMDALPMGSWPFCKGRPEDHAPAHSVVIGDEIDETHRDLDPDGGVIRFRSRQEKQRYLDAHQLEPFVRHVNGDRHAKSWAIMDPYTLEAATALVSRRGAGHGSENVMWRSFKSSVRMLTSLNEVA